MRPTRSDINGFHFDAMLDSATDVSTLGQQIEADGAGIRDTVVKLDWSGKARRAAEGRASRDAVQFAAVGGACDQIASAVTAGHATMTDLAGRLCGSAAGWESNGFIVGDTWTVRDGYNYGLADALATHDRETQRQLARLKQQRADEAAAGSAHLGRLATQFDEADQECAGAVHRAATALSELAPASAALGGAVGDRIASKLRDGKPLSELERRILDDATNLTPQQTDDLRQGKPASMSQAQYDFLRELTGDLDSVPMDEILTLGTGDQHGEIQSNIANAALILGIPNLSTAAGDRGGMAALPPTVRRLLTTELPTDKVTPAGESDRESTEIRDLAEYMKFTTLIAAGDPSTRLGSDVNRGILKQTSEIGGATATTNAALDTTTSQLIDNKELASALSAPLATAASDRIAAHDFITGEHMDVTCDNGGRYFADAHLNDLSKHTWGDKTEGLHTLFDWVGAEVDSTDPATARLAHESANAVGQWLGSEGSEKSNAKLGIRNPEFGRVLVDAVHPYLASYTGEGQPGIPRLGVDALSQKGLNQLFTALSTDGEAAVTLHSEASKWKNAMAFAYGTDPSAPAIAGHAGALAQAMEKGSERANDVLTDVQKDAYNEKVLAWNTGKEAAGLIPQTSWLAVPMAAGEQVALGPAPSDVTNEGTNSQSVAMDNSQTMLDYYVLAGYVEDEKHSYIYDEWMKQQAALPPHERSQLFDDDGKPRWEYARTPAGKDEMANLLPNLPGTEHDSAASAWKNAYETGKATPATEPTNAETK